MTVSAKQTHVEEVPVAVSAERLGCREDVPTTSGHASRYGEEAHEVEQAYG